jgi:DNA-binding MarR family transcriptional regulator
MTVSEPVALEIVGALSGLVRTARSYSHVRHEQLGATGVTLGVLKLLGQGPARSGDLACALGVSPSAVSRAVATVETLGYVHRTADPADARASLLALTAQGAEELDRQHRAHARLVGAVLASWDDAKALAVLDGMAELDSALSRAVAQMRTGGMPRHLAALVPDADPDPGHTDSRTDAHTLENAKAHA